MYCNCLYVRNNNNNNKKEKKKERGAFIGENAKGSHGGIYKSHTSVISTHFVDQV